MHLSAIEYAPEVSEADLLGLALKASQAVRVPSLAAAPISLECRFHSATAYGETGSEFMVGEVLVFHIRDGLCVNGKIDTAQLRPLCRIGGPNYAKLGEILSMQPIGQTPKTVLGA